MILVWVGIGLACGWYVLFYRRAAQAKKHKKPVAQSKHLKALPAYQKAMKRYTWLVRGLAGLSALLLLVTIVLSMRPASKSTEQPEARNRDIMLCLDVSGSMTAVDAKVTEVFAKLAEGFKGERIGLVIFDSSAATIFPLTDDYDYVIDTLNKTKEAYTNEDYSKDTYDIYSGVSEGEGSSLIGDGLASCALRFDKLDTKRSRSIILATDNYVNGNPIVDLKQAGALAKKNGIRVYGLNPGDYSTNYFVDQNALDYKRVVLSTGGDYYKFEDASAVPGIIEKITKQEATRFKGQPTLVVNDQPRYYIVVIVGLLGVIMLLYWRLEI